MQRTLQEINIEIEATKKELENVHGTETEVYARIVGYYRSVRNWNKGKKDEYNQRKMFTAKILVLQKQVPLHFRITKFLFVKLVLIVHL